MRFNANMFLFLGILNLIFCQITQLVYLNRQKCEKGIFCIKFLNKMVPKEVFCTICHSKRHKIVSSQGPFN